MHVSEAHSTDSVLELAFHSAIEERGHFAGPKRADEHERRDSVVSRCLRHIVLIRVVDGVLVALAAGGFECGAHGREQHIGFESGGVGACVCMVCVIYCVYMYACVYVYVCTFCQNRVSIGYACVFVMCDVVCMCACGRFRQEMVFVY